MILWNPGEIVFDEWISLPKILSGIFQHIGSREWVFLTGIYEPHIPGEKGAFLQNLTKLRNLH